MICKGDAQGRLASYGKRRVFPDRAGATPVAAASGSDPLGRAGTGGGPVQRFLRLRACALARLLARAQVPRLPLPAPPQQGPRDPSAEPNHREAPKRVRATADAAAAPGAPRGLPGVPLPSHSQVSLCASLFPSPYRLISQPGNARLTLFALRACACRFPAVQLAPFYNLTVPAKDMHEGVWCALRARSATFSSPGRSLRSCTGGGPPRPRRVRAAFFFNLSNLESMHMRIMSVSCCGGVCGVAFAAPPGALGASCRRRGTTRGPRTRRSPSAATARISATLPRRVDQPTRFALAVASCSPARCCCENYTCCSL